MQAAAVVRLGLLRRPRLRRGLSSGSSRRPGPATGKFRSDKHEHNTHSSLSKRPPINTGDDAAAATAAATAWRAPAVRVPTMDRLRSISQAWHLELEDDELAGLRACMGNSVEAYERVDALVHAGADGGFGPKPRHPRLPGGTRPRAEENPLNAWYVRCRIQQQEEKDAKEDEGPSLLLLRGKTLAVKDTIAVAGVPMMNGSRALEGFVPEFEATVVSRALDAGAAVVGKAVAEDLCCSGSSFATALGPVRNPHAPTHAAGGSSSGCGALLGAEAVDLALGTDQGGSVRIPAAWCGVVGLKPTFGLVPYTGVASHEPSLDHVGPMARTVADTALLLEAIAGLDAGGMDPRQPADKAGGAVPTYSELATGDVGGLRIGVLAEGLEGCEEDVRATTLAAATKLKEAGAEVEEVSVPLHRDSAAIWLPLALEGGHLTRMEGGGAGLFQRGFYPVSLQQAYRRGFRCHAAELSYTNKFYILLGEYLRESYGPLYYAHCQNLVPALTRAYDRLLLGELGDGAAGGSHARRTTPRRFDALLLPTLPIKALPLPTGRGLRPQDCLAQAWCMLQNTAAFDLTGHPALSVNAGWSRGKKAAGARGGAPMLPIGVQVVGRRWEDATVLNVGMAVERLCAGGGGK